MNGHEELYGRLQPPFSEWDPALLGSEFIAERAATRRIWRAAGYRHGIAAYLNFFLLREVILTHDAARPSRFFSLYAMAHASYKTFQFMQEMTHSGFKASGGIASETVRAWIGRVDEQHRQLEVPGWVMTYIGFNLLEMAEKEAGASEAREKQLHLTYMSKAYRLMGIAFSDDRDLMERFSRQVEEQHAGDSPNLRRHLKHFLLLGEVVGVSSAYEKIAPLLPDKTRKVFQNIYPEVRPGFLPRCAARAACFLLTAAGSFWRFWKFGLSRPTQ